MKTDPPAAVPTGPPHPLALALIDRLRDKPGSRVLEFGAGSARNTAALKSAGYRVDVADPQRLRDLEGPYAAILSTHALLHGSPEGIARALNTIAPSLQKDASLFATFGSVNDARYGIGKPLGPYTFAPTGGDETGVPHAFFDRERLQRMLESDFIIELLEERDVDGIAGSWAHLTTPLVHARHWFVVAHPYPAVLDPSRSASDGFAQ